MFIQQIAGTLSPTFGIFTLHRNGTRTSTGNCIGTIGNNWSQILPLAQTSVNISTWCYTFHVPVPAPFPYSVNIPLQRSYGSFPPTETDSDSDSKPYRYIVLCTTTGSDWDLDPCTDSFLNGYCTHFRDGSLSQGSESKSVSIGVNEPLVTEIT